MFFTTQLLELGIPVVVALNKTDINNKKDNKIDAELLSKKLGCPVVETSANKGNGLRSVISSVIAVIGKKQKAPYSDNAVDLSNKASVAEADRRRFDFVNGIVAEVETRNTLTKNKNAQDKV